MQPADLSGYLSKCISLYFEPSFPSRTLREVFHVVGNPALYAKDLVPAVDQNETLTRWVLRTDFLQNRIQEWIAESPKGQYVPRAILERVFTLLGRQASRNLVSCIEIQGITNSLPKKDNDRLNVRPSEQLRYGVAAEEFCQSRSFAFSENAFLGGFHFDLIAAALQKQKGPRDAISAIPVFFSEGIKTAHLAYEIGAILGEFRYNSHLFPAALCGALGKVLMFALHPKELLAKSYASFLAEGEKLKTGKWLHLEYRERGRFGTTAAEMGALFVSWMELIDDVEPAIRYIQEPYYLKTASPEHYTLASILHIAQAGALGKPRTESHRRAIQSLGLTEAVIDQVTKKTFSK